MIQMCIHSISHMSCMYVYRDVSIEIYIYIYICIYLDVYVNVWVCVDICVCLDGMMCAVNIYIYIYFDFCLCIYIYIYIFARMSASSSLDLISSRHDRLCSHAGCVSLHMQFM